MRRLVQQEIESAGSDSFLDIVSNIVGILIILVMVVSVRVKNAPQVAIANQESEKQEQKKQTDEELASSQAKNESIQKELKQWASDNRSIQHYVEQMGQQINKMKLAIAMQDQQRETLSLMVAVIEKKLSSHREQLNEDQQRELALKNNMADARKKLGNIKRRKTFLDAIEAETVQIENFPTPLSKPVFNNEVHFRLSAGRIVKIPLAELIEITKIAAQKQVQQLNRVPEITQTVGPVGGFSLRYTIGRVALSDSLRADTGRRFAVGFKRWEVVPIGSGLGETMAEAFAPESQFRLTLSTLNPKAATITVWTYPDSFNEFRQLKKNLYLAGFSVAGRPLPQDAPIAGSPRGTKSAAQ